MKKVIKVILIITSIIIINLILGNSIASKFNQGNLDLANLDYFGKFDMFHLFPNDPRDLVILTTSTLSIIAFNIIVLIQLRTLAKQKNGSN